jgi:hypothetical protein
MRAAKLPTPSRYLITETLCGMEQLKQTQPIAQRIAKCIWGYLTIEVTRVDVVVFISSLDRFANLDASDGTT